MNRNRQSIRRVFVLLAGAFTLVQSVQAQPFIYTGRDLLVGFRKLGSFATSYEMVSDIGQASSYSSLAPGTKVAITKFTLDQLTASFGDLNDLTWAVSGDVRGGDGGDTNVPVNTLWVTNPRTDPLVQSGPYTRLSSFGAAPVISAITSIGANAANYSGSVSAGPYNTSTAVQIPANNPLALSPQMGPNGDYQGSFQADVENTTPDSFTSLVRSDLYELRPTGKVDPHTGLTSGPGAYLGYFELDPDGTFSFTAAGGGTPPPPPPPVLSITRTNTLLTVSFTTTNGATYTLHYNASLTTGVPFTNWPTLGSPVTGNGSLMSMQDTVSGSARFYRMEAH